MNRENKVELLAPAGNYESFLGAIHAGADAVYIGGKKYGARAYADNFSDEEVCLAIRYAHLLGRKLYLTVNTLVRQEELVRLPEYLKPFYEEGLDGIIVQDFGVFHVVRELFPELELHVSTQMAVTGVYGAKLLKEQGAARVVPARELSLEEIRDIRQKADIEVEAFIHGAMCYCYSGLCLFSSMLGGRSGNRGRCAQPCRLPYEITGIPGGGRRDRDEPERYPLSLKDMCTLPILPELIEAGIDSFKIEGRMKSPEYAAGVTALYRKYIDRYYSKPNQPWKVEPEDMRRLRGLYIRSEIQEGYYHNHNGREMITPKKPSYSGTDDGYLQKIRERWLEQPLTIPVAGNLSLIKNQPAVLELCGDAGTKVRQKGSVVLPAVKQPLTAETAEKQLRKTGGTSFAFEKLTYEMESDCFLPVKALNDLRREALEAFENTLLSVHRRKLIEDYPARCGQLKKELLTADPAENAGKQANPYIAIMIDRNSQFRSVKYCHEADRLYLESECIPDETELASWKSAKAERQLFAAMPRVLRRRDEPWLTKFFDRVLKNPMYDGVLIRNLESLYYLKQQDYQGIIHADNCLYVWNRRAKIFLTQFGVSQTAPVELNKNDWHSMGIRDMEVDVYGRTPLMVTANCVRKTSGECQTHGCLEPVWLTDRYHTRFPVYTVCEHCYNVLYNSVPLSLHSYGKSIYAEKPSGVRVSFTSESPDEIESVLRRFSGFFCEMIGDEPQYGHMRQTQSAEYAFTKGHYKRGAV